MPPVLAHDYSRDIQRHDQWLHEHDKRLRDMEIELATSRVKLALFTAVVSSLSSAVVSGVVMLLVKKVGGQ